ncbi:hypothetical protein CU016_1723 [Enterococcus lactis]|nr:hypothetical protein [Enterococcus lactis]MBL5014958.1 hypothetical protein [Enterococcus lactis]
MRYLLLEDILDLPDFLGYMILSVHHIRKSIFDLNDLDF